MAAAAAAGAGVAGSLLGTVGKVQEADLTAKSLQSEARSIEEQSAFDARQQQRRNRLVQGEANAQAAASGVSLSSGSPLLLELDRVKQGEIERQSIIRAGSVAAAGRRYGARLARRSIPYTILGGILGAGSAGAGGLNGGGGKGFGNASAYSDATAYQARGYS